MRPEGCFKPLITVARQKTGMLLEADYLLADCSGISHDSSG
jgi:hypothetical protein